MVRLLPWHLSLNENWEVEGAIKRDSWAEDPFKRLQTVGNCYDSNVAELMR